MCPELFSKLHHCFSALCYTYNKPNLSLWLCEGVKEFEARWIGWAGVNVPDEAGQKALTKALAEKVQLFNYMFSRWILISIFTKMLYIIMHLWHVTWQF